MGASRVVMNLERPAIMVSSVERELERVCKADRPARERDSEGKSRFRGGEVTRAPG